MQFDYEHQMFEPAERIAFELNRLERDKFIQRTPSGSIYKLNGWMPLQKKVVALELKLSRIQDVLRQAIANLEFADESYVGLPIETASRLVRSSASSPFMKHGIGIVGLNRKHYRVFRLPTSRKKRTDPVFQSYCVERFWRHYPQRHFNMSCSATFPASRILLGELGKAFSGKEGNCLPRTKAADKS